MKQTTKRICEMPPATLDIERRLHFSAGYFDVDALLLQIEARSLHAFSLAINVPRR
ncbi:MAG: hypothetical protein JSU96_01505 [Acidobacteriota bacterium]|nr:MAG: hypothetical protein JSU96_01505 [Acidobacteriota bacterium]